MKKFKLYYDKEKEELWLNEMCQKGWALSSFFLGVYGFEPCEPGKYTYQIDMPQRPAEGRIRMGRRELSEYIDFVESTGAECVCKWGFYVIFRKEASKGDFKLYTDKESQIRLYQRIRTLFLVCVVWDIFACLLNTHNILEYFQSYWMYAKGMERWMLVLWIVMLVLCYFIMGAFCMLALRFTRKIRRLRQEA